MKTTLDENNGIAYCEVESKEGKDSYLYKIYKKTPEFVNYTVHRNHLKAFKWLLGSIGDIMGIPEVNASQDQEMALIKQRKRFFEFHKDILEEFIYRETFKIEESFKVID